MSAEVLRVLTARDTASRDHYPTTLFSAGEAYAGACTAKTTIYCANIAAGMMLAQFAKYLGNLPVDPDIQLNLLTSEITVSRMVRIVSRAPSDCPASILTKPCVADQRSLCRTLAEQRRAS